jgi:hypothetical protein
LGVAVSMIQMTYVPTILAGLVLIVFSIGTYLLVETRWFATKLGIGFLRAYGAVMLGFFEGTALLMFVTFSLTH